MIVSVAEEQHTPQGQTEHTVTVQAGQRVTRSTGPVHCMNGDGTGV